MPNLSVSYQIEFEDHRCQRCHRFYTFEKDACAPSQMCPWCLKKSLTDMQESYESVERSNSALRGVITKLKKK